MANNVAAASTIVTSATVIAFVVLKLMETPNHNASHVANLVDASDGYRAVAASETSVPKLLELKSMALALLVHAKSESRSETLAYVDNYDVNRHIKRLQRDIVRLRAKLSAHA